MQHKKEVSLDEVEGASVILHLKGGPKDDFYEEVIHLDLIDCYEPKDYGWTPRVAGGNVNGCLYDWDDMSKVFRFVSDQGNLIRAELIGDGQVEICKVIAWNYPKSIKVVGRPVKSTSDLMPNLDYKKIIAEVIGDDFYTNYADYLMARNEEDVVRP